MLTVSQRIDAGARNWAPRVGWQAGRLRSAADLSHTFASAILLAFLVLEAVSLGTGSPIAIGLAVIFAAAGVMLFAYSIRLRNRYHRVASEHLGVRVSWKAKEYVPRDAGRYEQWCRDNHLTPYAAATDAPVQP